MSGLAAIVTFDGGAVIDDALRMVDAVPHRCHSGIRRWEADAAELIHLCTHDSAEVDPDPLLTSAVDRSLAVVADARIDNHEEVVALLCSDRRGTDAMTDAELIMACYRRWGVDAATHLIGDFAFVVWDAVRRRVYAARDPMAMRPLYFRVEPHCRVLLASEAKQILAVSDVPRRIQERTIAHYMMGRFDPLERSFYEGIEVLAPAHSMTVDEAGTHTWRHWDFDPNHEIRYGTEDEYVEHFRELVIESVRVRVRPGRPIGVLLSGGIDSGTAAGVASWLRATDSEAVPEIRAYTWDFEDLVESDERHISKHLVGHFEIPETTIAVGHLGPLAKYPLHGPNLDTPFLGAFQPAIERSLETAAREGCRLVMSGDRGDLIAGAQIVSYPRLIRSGNWRQLGRQLRRQRVVSGEPMGTILLRDLIAPAVRRLRRQRMPRPQPLRHSFPPWMSGAFAESTGVADGLGDVAYDGAEIDDSFREERRRLILAPMHMRGMMWTERTHATHGLGFADPWSDRRLAEFALAIPPQVINRPGRNDKQLARNAMTGLLPDTFLSTASKILPTPLYRRGLFDEGASTVNRLLLDSHGAAHGFIDADAALNAYEKARQGDKEQFAIWWTICVEMWLRAHWPNR